MHSIKVSEDPLAKSPPSLWTSSVWGKGEKSRGVGRERVRACSQTFATVVPRHPLCIRSWCKLLLAGTLTVSHPRIPRGSQSRERARRKFSSTGERAPGYHRAISKIQADAGSWLGTKNALYYCAPLANSFSWDPLVSSYTTAIVSITACLVHAPKKCRQSENYQFDIKSPSDFKILSARKLKTLFQKYKFKLTTGIQACIGHILRKY